MDDIIWQGWIQALQPHEHLIPNLINAINEGKLADQLTLKRKVKIDLQDVKTLLKSFLRNQNLDNATKRLAYEQKNLLSPAEIRNMLEQAKVAGKDTLASISKERWPDMPINKYFKD